jgi:hypothetical protein
VLLLLHRVVGHYSTPEQTRGLKSVRCYLSHRRSTRTDDTNIKGTAVLCEADGAVSRRG